MTVTLSPELLNFIAQFKQQSNGKDILVQSDFNQSSFIPSNSNSKLYDISKLNSINKLNHLSTSPLTDSKLTKFNNESNINTSLRMLDEPEDRTQEPITSKTDINRLIEYYLIRKKYRNALLITLGVNFGIRVSDLRQLKLKQLINSETGEVKDYFYINEQKTSKKNKIWINDASKKMLIIFLNQCHKAGKTKDLQDYLFTSESNNKEFELISYLDADGIVHTKEIQAPVSYNAITPILLNACKALGIQGKHNTHCLRKTFSWAVLEHYKTNVGEDYNGRGLLFLQKRFKHSSTLITEHYVGITDTEDMNVCMSLNLGLEAIDFWLSKNRLY